MKVKERLQSTAEVSMKLKVTQIKYLFQTYSLYKIHIIFPLVQLPYPQEG